MSRAPFLCVFLFQGLLLAQETTPPVAQPVDPKAEAYAAAAKSIEADLRAALDELAAQRDRIAKERAPLAIETEKVAAELREMRRKADLAKTSRDAAESEFEQSEKDLRVWRDEKAYIDSLVFDLQRGIGATAYAADAEGVPANPTLQATVSPLLDELGGQGKAWITEGEAVVGDGAIVPGRFAKVGPVTWFRSADGKSGGLISEDHELRPRLLPQGESSGELEHLFAGETARLSFDPTLGSAVALTETETSALDHVKQGGFWAIPILILAAFALITAIWKFLQLGRIREFSASVVQKTLAALNAGKVSEAKEAVGGIRHPARRVLDRGISLISERPTISRDDVEESMFEVFLEETPPLQRGLPILAIVSATAPLLGLLGTVTGMMETFRLITVFGTGDAKSLASGISEALITTELGLVVAIPALIAHSLLSRKVQGIKSTMEMTSLAFLNGVRQP